jgi:hypothetical protein
MQPNSSIGEIRIPNRRGGITAEKDAARDQVARRQGYTHSAREDWSVPVKNLCRQLTFSNGNLVLVSES